MTLHHSNGAITALLDEYEKTITEFIVLLDYITDEELVTVVDYQTKDLNCISIQTILTHLVKAGYNYTMEIRRYLGETVDFKSPVTLSTTEAYQEAIKTMFQANVTLFKDYPDAPLEVTKYEHKMKVRWGQTYDIEQLMEHAIVHILRHRRQVENFLKKLQQPASEQQES